MSTVDEDDAPASHVYSVLEETLPRGRRVLTWAASLLLGSALGHVLTPPHRRWFLVEKATGRVVTELGEGWEQEQPIGWVLARELEELTVEEFEEAWLAPPG